MANNLQITVKNKESELNSFPIDQSLVLEFSEAVEDSYLDSHINLVQALDSGSLIHIGDTYNQNVGLVKENFKPVSIDVKVTSTNPFQVTVKPKQPLTPGHSYQLLVQESLPIEHLTAIKDVSYSDSHITVLSSSGRLGTFQIEVVSDSNFTGNSHLVTLQVESEVKTVDLNKTVEVSISGLKLKLSGMVFIKGETFLVEVLEADKKLSASFVATLKASSSKDVKPIDSDYTNLSLDDLINYNNGGSQSQDNSITAKDVTYELVATGFNSFIAKFNKEVVELLDLDSMSYSVREAFNMYTLSSLDLYDRQKKYEVKYEILSKSEVEFFIEELV